MKIAISSTGDSIDSLISEQFGRCEYFAVIDMDSMENEFIKNPGIDLSSGAGPKAAGILINAGVSVLLTGRVGDKAEDVLKRGDIKIINGLSNSMAVKEGINYYMNKTKNEA
jgi:predicted Fe-Mo cluster-binding NifX family protein